MRQSGIDETSGGGILLFPLSGLQILPLILKIGKRGDSLPGEPHSQFFPVPGSQQLALGQDGLNGTANLRNALPVIGVLFQLRNLPPQPLHGINHLGKGMEVLRGVVLQHHLIVRPGRQIPVADKAVVRQVSRPSVTQVHNGVLAELRHRAGIPPVLQVILSAHLVPEVDLLLHRFPIDGAQLIAIGGYMIDYHGGCPGEIAVGPGVRKDVHSDPNRLQGTDFFGLSQRFQQQRAVGLADQPVFVQVSAGAVGLLHREVSGQEMEGCPNSGNVLQA